MLLPDEEQSRILVAIKEPQEAWWNFKELHDRLYAKGFTIYPGTAGREATWRLSVLGDIDRHDIERFLEALASAITVMRGGS